jgi:hypothetical protein
MKVAHQFFIKNSTDSPSHQRKKVMSLTLINTSNLLTDRKYNLGGIYITGCYALLSL